MHLVLNTRPISQRRTGAGRPWQKVEKETQSGRKPSWRSGDVLFGIRKLHQQTQLEVWPASELRTEVHGFAGLWGCHSGRELCVLQLWLPLLGGSSLSEELGMAPLSGLSPSSLNKSIALGVRLAATTHHREESKLPNLSPLIEQE